MGSKKQNLARVLDGKEVARLVEEREKKDLAKSQKQSQRRRTTKLPTSTPPPALRKRTYKRTRFHTPSPPLSDLGSEAEVSSDDSILSTITVQTPTPFTPIQPSIPSSSTPCPPN